MIYDQLRADAAHISPAPIEGTWQVIRFQPDFATGESFNIGVIFFEKRNSVPHARILPNLTGFRAIYGNNGADNFKFLLSLLREQVIHLRQAISPSPQITFGEKKFVAGNNPQEIVDHLFRSMVTFASANDDDGDGWGATMQTQKLRDRIARLAQKKMGTDWRTIFHREPISVSDPSGIRHSLDLPIWRGEDLVSAQIYGTIVSAQFRSAAHRAASLASGYVNFNQASEFARNAKGGLLILRPSGNNELYDDALMRDIDNDIDKITWTYAKKKSVIIHVGETADELANAALALL
jgi:hypothetical protein